MKPCQKFFGKVYIIFLSIKPANNLIGFLILGAIQSFTFARMFSEPEKEEFFGFVDSYKNFILVIYAQFYVLPKIPNLRLILNLSTPKFHWLITHTVDFIRKNGYWGLVSEQIIESSHSIIYTSLKRRCNTKSRKTFLLFVAKEAALKNFVFDNVEK